MKTTLCTLAALLLMAAATGCQTCGPCGGGFLSGGDVCGDACGGMGDCGCGDACGSVCGDACGGSCGTGGLIGHLGNGGGIGMGGRLNAMRNGYGPVGHGGALVGGALSGLHGPTPGGSRIAGNFSFQGHGGRQATQQAALAAQPGPPTAAVTYPYYTTRGPRDFFMANPPPLGR